jgi:hypothetical protein
MKRNIIEKYQRLAQIREHYDEQIIELGKKQIEILVKVVREFKLETTYEYREYMHYDWLEVGEDGSIELWERGRCGDPDSYSTSFHLDPLIIDGKKEEYEQKLRKQLQAKADAVAKAIVKEKEQKRARLEQDLRRISEELGKMEAV